MARRVPRREPASIQHDDARPQDLHWHPPTPPPVTAGLEPEPAQVQPPLLRLALASVQTAANENASDLLRGVGARP
eukprot:1375185-Rhodomonas_salina.1